MLAFWAAAVAVAVAVGLVAAGVFKHHSSSQTAVARYITRVDAVEQQMRVPLTSLIAAYRSFSKSATSPRTVKKLAAAEKTLRTLQRRLSALEAPPAATKLRALVLRLIGAEVAATHEVDEIARFLPPFAAAGAASKRAAAALARGVAAATPPTPRPIRGTAAQIAQAKAAYAAVLAKSALAQAAAVDAYDAALAAVLQRLRPLRPPAMLAPAYGAQVRTFEATRAAGAALARELRTKNRTRAPLLSRRLAQAERIAAGVTAQRAQIAAIKAYNARIRAIGGLQTDIQHELSRIQATGG